MKILFVDDDRYEMLGLVERLEEEGYKVEAATSPDMAYRKLKRFQPDLIITDLIMSSDPDDPSPTQNRYVGIQFCRAIREELKLACPIIVLTFVNDPLIQSEARKYAEDLLVKPVSSSVLLRRITQLLRSA